MPSRYEPIRLREELQSEIDDRNRMMHRARMPDGKGAVWDDGEGIKSNHHLQALNRTDQKRLESMTPPDLKDLEKKGIEVKQIEARIEQLKEFIVKEGNGFPAMQSQREMQECPTGATNICSAFERKIAHFNVDRQGNVVRVQGKDQQSARDEYRDLMRLRYKDRESEFPDIGNLELLRPENAEKDNLLNYMRRSFANPASRLSAEEYEEMMGVEGMLPSVRNAHEAEKAGQGVVMSIEDHLRRLYGVKDTPVVLCKAMKKNGDPCGSNPVAGSDFCFFHGGRKKEK